MQSGQEMTGHSVSPTKVMTTEEVLVAVADVKEKTRKRYSAPCSIHSPTLGENCCRQ